MMVKHLVNLPTTNESGCSASCVASSFTFGRVLTADVWGHASDRIGRKPVALIGLSVIGACSVAFGLSTKFTMPIGSSEAAPDMMPVGRRRPKDEGAGGQLAYHLLERNHDSEGGDVPPRLPSGGYGRGRPVCPVNGNSGDRKIHQGAGSGLGSGWDSPIAGVVELALKCGRKRTKIDTSCWTMAMTAPPPTTSVW